VLKDLRPTFSWSYAQKHNRIRAPVEVEFNLTLSTIVQGPNQSDLVKT